MRWLALAIVAWVFLALETGLKDLLAFGGPRGIAPSFVLPLAVFLALAGPPRAALWACLALGLLVDLTSAWPLEQGAGVATIPGPYALGYLLAGKFVLTMRAVLIRHNPLTIVFLSVVGAMLVHAVVAAMLSIRAAYDPIVWDGAAQLLIRLGRSLYTGLTGLLVAALAPWLVSLLGLEHLPRYGWRGF